MPRLQHHQQNPGTPPHMIHARSDSVRALKRFLFRSHFPQRFSEAILDFIRLYFEGTTPHTDFAFAQESYQAQMDIGHSFIFRGYFLREWLHPLCFIGHERPNTAMTSLIFHMWHEFFHNIWLTRNAILHDSHSMVTRTLDTLLNDQLLWYLSNRDALARPDQ